MNSTNPFAVVILAAGKGTRMKSSLHKVMHPIAGRPMLEHVLAAVASLGAERSVVGLARKTPLDPVIATYLNRLSDLLFVMARHENHKSELPEDIW